MKEQNINRRKFVASLGIVGATATLHPFSVFSKPLAKPDEAAIGVMKCKPYLQAAHADKITVRWITNFNCYSWVEYGEGTANLNLKAHNVIDGLVQANNTINDITLHNLLPGKTYYYQVVSKKINQFNAGKVSYAETYKSEVYSFTTPKQNLDKVEFLVFNDVHDRPETFAQLMKYQDAGKKDFVLLNGDIFSSLKGGENQVVEHLLNPVGDLFATHIPFIYSRGNHEARGEYARQLPGYFNGRENKFYYSFQYGPMYAIVLDTGEDKEDAAPPYGGIVEFEPYRMAQKKWLEQEVQKEAFRKAKYKIVFCHIPPYYTANKDAHGTIACREIFGPVLNKANIDLMICGHTHRYKVRPAVAGIHNYAIVIGGGPEDGDRTVISVKADYKKLDLKITDDSGKIVGTFNL